MADTQARDHAMSRTSTSTPEDLARETTNPEYGDLESPDEPMNEKLEDRRHGAASLATSRSKNTLGLERTVTRRETVLSRVRTRPPVGNFNHPLEHQKTTVDELVDFDGDDDPYRPLNWKLKKKVLTTVLYGFTTMSATWASSAFAPGTNQVAHDFHVGTEVATLGTTLFLFGFGIGPMFFAPLSEVYGRKNAVLPPMFVAAMFAFGTGAAKDIQTIVITRFFAGVFASAPVTNTGGVLADLFPASQVSSSSPKYCPLE